jgi:voltage-gated potassium channel
MRERKESRHFVGLADVCSPFMLPSRWSFLPSFKIRLSLPSRLLYPCSNLVFANRAAAGLSMADSQTEGRNRALWRDRWRRVIFDNDTLAGRWFDGLLLTLIVVNLSLVALDSVRSIGEAYRVYLDAAEWIITAIFTIEYAARLVSAPNARRYATSFYGLVDLLAIAPVYVSVLFGLTHSFTVVRSLRLLRVFRILKLSEYLGEAAALGDALRESARKIVVFLFGVLSVVMIVGTLMYEIEGEANGFTSIPVAMYWAIVTVTTVGYGDISPKTVVGRIIASFLMIVGFGIIAVPTGIVSFELSRASQRGPIRQCPACSLQRHDPDATFCKLCGTRL